MSRDVSASLDMTTKIDRAVVLAAGRGTRMRELTNDVPKPMIEVRGKPVLQHIVEGLRDAGIRDCLIMVGYHAEAVQDFFGDGSRYNVAIQYTTQTVQDGTGRVVELARDFMAIAIHFELWRYFDQSGELQTRGRSSDDVEAIITVTRGEDVSKGGAVFSMTKWSWSIFAKNQNQANRRAPGITPGFTRFGQAFSISSQN